MPNFLLEIGTEELPADFVDSAISQWKKLIPEDLTQEFLKPREIKLYGTPRRLAVLIEGLETKQPDREEEIKGPPVSVAFKDGKATPAAEGFARKQGVSLDDFQIRQTEKGEFVFIEKKIQGQETSTILQQLLPQWIGRLEGRRFMRWGDGDIRFPRPIRHILSLWDGDVLPFELVCGSTILTSDRYSMGHRVLHPEQVTINHADDYIASLEKAYILADIDIRRSKIEAEIKMLAHSVSGTAEISADLLTEVTNLVEYPTPVLGKFEPEFLQLPAEVITTVMVKHQRYFPIKDEQGKLMPYFITISNGDPQKSAIIAEGNAKVIRARLADAQFFYHADCDEHLETYLPELENVTFQENLGSIHDKVNRIIGIAQLISEQLELNEQQASEVDTTASLCKADLVTQMVYEFPELQGIMGEKYALVSGESPTVARGIFEHYLPRNAGDIMPETLNGQVVGISDRLDTIVGIIGIGMMPTGSSDPFALRRAANAIINITWHGNLAINLQELLKQTCADFISAHREKESPLAVIRDFFIQRISTLLQDELKIDYDLVNAVLGDNDEEYIDRALTNLLDVRDRALFLQQIRNNGLLGQIYATVNRSTKLATKGDLNYQELDAIKVVNADLFESPSEIEFYQALQQLAPITQQAKSDRNYQILVDGLLEINPIVSNFFDGENSVLVMADDENIKTNRLNLLALLRNNSRVLADFGAIVK
jgi:glycyl-tRNA synthetase beta chain